MHLNITTLTSYRLHKFNPIGHNLAELNELLAFKYSLSKSMARRNTALNQRTGYLKYITLDMPFSCDAFNHIFKRFLNAQPTQTSKGSKLKLTITDLREILGAQCHILVQKNTTTRQRLIGDVTIHHRAKHTPLYDNAACPR